MIHFMIFIVTFFATLLSAMSGGGASAINLPVFLMLGIPFPLAASMQKWSSAFWTLPAAYNYLRRRRVDWFFIIVFSVIGVFGVIFAVTAMLSIRESILKRMVGALILLFVLYAYVRKDLGLHERRELSICRRFLAYPVGLILGFYEGIFGAGNAIAFGILTMHTRGHDMTRAMGHYYAVSFLWVLATAALLTSHGIYDVSLTIPAIIGGILGGHLGSRFAAYKGNAFVKNIFVVIGGLLGLYILIRG